jgi:dTDP-glucose pyrophosphorylase
MWGIVPAAGAGSRIQPLAFSKELLPVGSWRDGEIERPRAVSEYLVERMIRAGATKICFVISPGKSDIMGYFGGSFSSAAVCYTVQPRPVGLCDALFRSLPLLAKDEVVNIGLPDTIWYPDDGLCRLPDDGLSFLLFPVERPEFFDAVVTDSNGSVLEIQVKQKGARSNWIWGAFRMPVSVLQSLYELWCERNRSDEYMGTLVNEYIRRGGRAVGVRSGTAYVDVGTLHGYREAMQLLNQSGEEPNDRSCHVMERAEQPVTLGFSDRSRLEDFQPDGEGVVPGDRHRTA